MRLNSAAQRPNSSRPPSGTRADRSPAAIRRAARPAASTGRRIPRAMKPAVASATRTASSPPASSPSRSCASAVSTSVAGNTKYRSGRSPWRPPTTSTGWPRERLPGVAELAAGDDRPQVRRHLVERPGHRRRLVRGAVAEVGDRGHVAAQLEGIGQPAGAERGRIGRRRDRARAAARRGCSRPAGGRRREPVAQRRVDERVHAETDGSDRQRNQGDERDREARADAAHRSRSRAVAGGQPAGRAAL